MTENTTALILAHRAEVAEFIDGTGKHPNVFSLPDHYETDTLEIFEAEFIADRFDLMTLLAHPLVSISELDSAWALFRRAYGAIRNDPERLAEAAFLRLLCTAVIEHSEEVVIAHHDANATIRGAA